MLIFAANVVTLNTQTERAESFPMNKELANNGKR